MDDDDTKYKTYEIDFSKEVLLEIIEYQESQLDELRERNDVLTQIVNSRYTIFDELISEKKDNNGAN